MNAGRRESLGVNEVMEGKTDLSLSNGRYSTQRNGYIVGNPFNELGRVLAL